MRLRVVRKKNVQHDIFCSRPETNYRKNAVFGCLPLHINALYVLYVCLINGIMG